MTSNILLALLRRIGRKKEEDMYIQLRNIFFLFLILLDITDRVCAGQDAVEHDHYRRVKDHYCRAVHS